MERYTKPEERARDLDMHSSKDTNEQALNQKDRVGQMNNEEVYEDNGIMFKHDDERSAHREQVYHRKRAS